MKLRDRAFSGEDDFRKFKKMLTESYAVTRHPFYNWAVDGWEEDRYAIRHEQEIVGNRIWEKDIHVWETVENSDWKMVGAAVYKDSEVDYEIHPSYRDIEDDVFDWVENRHRRQKPDNVEHFPLQAGACSHRDWETVFKRRGYRKISEGNYYRKWSFKSDVIPDLPIPDGYTVRHVRYQDDEDLKKRIDLFHELFPDRHKLSLEALRLLESKATTYRQDLDLALINPEGTFVGISTGWFDAENRIGFIDPLGARSGQRRSGLGKIIFTQALSALKDIGATHVFLRNSSDNHPAVRFYDTIGMKIFDQETTWQKDF